MSVLFMALGLGVSESLAQDALIKLQNAKLPPVTFSHTAHVDKQKIGCTTCHHKDSGKPKACATCHKIETSDKTPSAKEAFHERCRTCHKEQADKGGKTGRVPTKCNDCHKQ